MRIAVTILACVMFLVWGLFADEALRVMSWNIHKGQELTPIQLLYETTFSLDENRFTGSISTSFCGVMIVVLLLTSGANAWIEARHFLGLAFCVTLSFGIALGIYLAGLIFPYQLFIGAMYSHHTLFNYGFDLISILIWLMVGTLVLRFCLRKRRKS